MREMRAWFWWVVGFAGLGLALVGTVLPIMPTVPFLLVAAYGFNRSSPRFHAMIVNHKVFGPQIREWHEHRAIAPAVKIFVVVSMAVGLAVSFHLLPLAWWVGQFAVLAAVAIYIVTRANPPKKH
ncbi:hypothetical protein IX56_10580 [Paracoccus sanguinis]|uniref:DUF454 domain-containing protein n=2 Tax=Paracoccus sanguinis TaxID=1545044 RepID=A0A099GGY8_9RHOB|nr:hypothetical protein IX56_10580 [Paracoccus sanguinis]